MKPWYGIRRSRSSSIRSRRFKRTRKYCGLTVKDILNVLSSLALPLMLGVFTVVITYDQKHMAEKQRLEDRRLADEERDQDLNISREQRREDRELAREQRLQDLNQSRLQRELDRIIANETREISEQTRAHEFKIEDKRYLDAILTNYIKEMSDLLEKNDGSLANISLTGTIVCLKTLTIIRQLDSSRNSQIIRFLYAAGQLNTCNTFLFDLSDADLLGIDMSSRKPNEKMHNLYLYRTDLTGSSFVNRDLTGANFSNAILIDVNFSFTTLINIDLSYTIFNGSLNIYKSRLGKLNLAFAYLAGIDFTTSLLSHAETSERASLSQMNFTDANLTNTRFSRIRFYDVHFRNILNSIDFSNSTLVSIVFEKCFGIPFEFFLHTISPECDIS